jgi:hypothetical protein
MNLSSVSKAIAGGVITAVMAELAKFGFQPKGASASALSVIITAVVAYVVGHVAVYFAPSNVSADANPKNFGQ